MKLVYNDILMELTSLKLGLTFLIKENNEVYTRYTLIMNGSSSTAIEQEYLAEKLDNTDRIYKLETETAVDAFVGTANGNKGKIISEILRDLWDELTKNYNTIIKETGAELPFTVSNMDETLSKVIRRNMMKIVPEELYKLNDINTINVNMGWGRM